jgi:DNA-binding HxlR family transcriptional regulator
MLKIPGTPTRGSTSGRPIMVLLDALGQKWTLRILWELSQERSNFRALQQRCDGVSPTVLNNRLKGLRQLALIDLKDDGYGLTKQGKTLAAHLSPLDQWAKKWAKDLNK